MKTLRFKYQERVRPAKKKQNPKTQPGCFLFIRLSKSAEKYKRYELKLP